MAAYEEVQQTMLVDEEAGPPRAVGRTWSRSWPTGLAVALGIAIVCMGSVGLFRHAAALRPQGLVQLQGDDDVATNVEMAKMAEQAERYNDMKESMTKVVKMAGALTEEQRNLLSVAFKNLVGARRSAWRIISSLEQKANDKGGEPAAEEAKSYREEIEKEMLSLCDELLALINDQLLPAVENVADTTEAKVFYLKMKGDYWRYITEVTAKDQKDGAANSSKEAYLAAIEAAKDLPSTHPIKLGLALNYSVFLYEIANDHKAACDVAKKAFDDAIAELDSLKEDSYKESTLIMQLLRDNLTLWTSEASEEPKE